jgi:hypothetical protein
MEKDGKKALYLLILLLPIYGGLVYMMAYAMYDGSLIPLIFYTAFTMTAAMLLLRNFFLKTILKGKRPESPVVVLKAGEGDGGRLTITISPYITVGKMKLLLDGVEIAEGQGGDRFKVPIADGKHVLTVKYAANVERTVSVEGETEMYVWINRNVRGSEALMSIDDITRGKEEVAARDAAEYERTRRTMNIVFAVLPVVSTLMVVVMFSFFP